MAYSNGVGRLLDDIFVTEITYTEKLIEVVDCLEVAWKKSTFKLQLIIVALHIFGQSWTLCFDVIKQIL